MDTIPSIPEHLAIGEIAALYQDIKDTLQVPVTNLVWRHLATMNGALGVVWRCIKPLYIGGLLEADAHALRDIDGLPQLPVWSRPSLRVAGIGAADEKSLRAVLANYDQTNPRNLVAFMALLAKLNGEAVTPMARTVPLRADPTPVADPLPRLIPEHEMSPETRRLAQRFNNIGLKKVLPEIAAGVPRHLAHWPGFLALSVEAMLPFEREIGACITGVQYQAKVYGRALSGSLGEFDTRVPTQDITMALTRFTSAELIANFIPKVRMLRGALPE